MGSIFLPFLWFISTAAFPAARAPTGQWNVDFADAQCVATRSYGSAEEPLHLALKAAPVGNVMQIAVIRKGGWTEADQVEAIIGIDMQPPIKANMLRFSTKGTGLRIYLLNMPASDFALVRGAKTLAVSAGSVNESFSLSQVEPLLKIMDDCVADLRKVWNVTDPSGEQSSLSTRAKGNLSGLLTSDDYPGPALRKEQTGAVRFAALINETGRVADCTIIETSKVPALGAQTCALIKERARFKPATGPDGKPAKDAIINKVAWELQ